MAVFIHVSERDPLRARLTSDVDAAVDRRRLNAVIEAASKIGLVYRHTAGVDTLVEAAHTGSAVGCPLGVSESESPA